MITLKEFAGLMAMISAAYGLEVSRKRIALYYGYLKDIAAPDLKRGIDKIIKTRKYISFPLISEIRRACIGIDDAELDALANVAWERAKTAIIAGIPNDDVLSLAVKIAFGGWREFGETNPEYEHLDRNHFISCYKIATREMSEPHLLKDTLLADLAATRKRIAELKEKPKSLPSPEPR